MDLTRWRLESQGYKLVRSTRHGEEMWEDPAGHVTTAEEACRVLTATLPSKHKAPAEITRLADYVSRKDR